MRFPSKANLLAFLRAVEFPVETILDVGAHEQTLELRLAYAGKHHLLFEPATNFHDALKANYAGIDHVIFSTALSDNDGEGKLRTYSVDGVAITHSGLLSEDVDDGTQSAISAVSTSRLDTIMRDRSCKKPYLLKIDVDGFELPIFQGAQGIYDDISCIIMEATTETFVSRMNAIASQGFRFFEIIDQCYYHGVMAQVDIVFLAEKHMTHEAFRPWQTRQFHWSDWISMAQYEGVVTDPGGASR